MNAIATVLNKLSGKDTVTRQDVWYKTFLDSVEFDRVTVTEMNGADVTMGETFKILIPFGNYQDYFEWKNGGYTNGSYTMSAGDYIILHSHIPDSVTSSTVVSISNKYSPNACRVKSVRVVPDNGIATYQLLVQGV